MFSTLEAGGEPSTLFPPGELVKLLATNIMSTEKRSPFSIGVADMLFPEHSGVGNSSPRRHFRQKIKLPESHPPATRTIQKHSWSVPVIILMPELRFLRHLKIISSRRLCTVNIVSAGRARKASRGNHNIHEAQYVVLNTSRNALFFEYLGDENSSSRQQFQLEIKLPESHPPTTTTYKKQS